MSDGPQEVTKRTSITLSTSLYKAVWREAIETDRTFNDVLIDRLVTSYHGSPFFSPSAEVKHLIDSQELLADAAASPA